MSCIDCRLTYIFDKKNIVCLIIKRNKKLKKIKFDEKAGKEEEETEKKHNLYFKTACTRLGKFYLE